MVSPCSSQCYLIATDDKQVTGKLQHYYTAVDSSTTYLGIFGIGCIEVEVLDTLSEDLHGLVHLVLAGPPRRSEPSLEAIIFHIN